MDQQAEGAGDDGEDGDEGDFDGPRPAKDKQDSEKNQESLDGDRAQCDGDAGIVSGSAAELVVGRNFGFEI